MTEAYLQHLHDAIRSVATEAGWNWLEQEIHKLKTSPALEDDLTLLSAMARRKLGQQTLGEMAATIVTPAGGVTISGWAVGDAGRILLLLEAVRCQPEHSTALVSAVYRYGDELERAAILRALVLFPDAAALKPLALEAGRVNSLVLYQALALDNPYPATYYTEHEFNQLILKAVFMGLPIERVVGLEQRANAELTRMCEDFAEERIAAGRPVPVDLWLALGPCASPRGERLLLIYVRDEDPRQRYYAALALVRRQAVNPSLGAVLEERLSAETDERVRSVLRAGLAS
jgi:hypothetical protein